MLKTLRKLVVTCWELFGRSILMGGNPLLSETAARKRAVHLGEPGAGWNKARRAELAKSVIESIEMKSPIGAELADIKPAVAPKPRMTRKRIARLDLEDPGWRVPVERNRLVRLLEASHALVERFCSLQEILYHHGVADEVLAKARRGWTQSLRRFTVRARASEPTLDPELIDKVIDNALRQIWQKRQDERRRFGLIYNDTMTPSEYEHFCARLLTAKGWQAKATKASGDQGVDVVARWGERCLVVQAKKYTSPVGNAAVQEVYAGMSHYRADHGAVVTMAGFTKSARDLARSTGILLLHHEELAALSPCCKRRPGKLARDR